MASYKFNETNEGYLKNYANLCNIRYFFQLKLAKWN